MKTLIIKLVDFLNGRIIKALSINSEEPLNNQETEKGKVSVFGALC